MDRYAKDVLTPGWQRGTRPPAKDVSLEVGMVVEVDVSGFCGAVVNWENGLVVLEDRQLKRRSFPVGPGFRVDGQPVNVRIPARQGSAKPKYTASGSRVGQPRAARLALPSRIYVEGRHDAELVEKVWGDDLRHVGVVVEFLGGIDNLVDEVRLFAPAPGRRLGVLVDHLVDASKESRIASQVADLGYGGVVMITGHRFIDVWQAIRPQALGLAQWPDTPRGQDFKTVTLAALGLPHSDQADIARAWQQFLGGVRTYRDLDVDFTREVERLIDFVTQDHQMP